MDLKLFKKCIYKKILSFLFGCMIAIIYFVAISIENEVFVPIHSYLIYSYMCGSFMEILFDSSADFNKTTL